MTYRGLRNLIVGAMAIATLQANAEGYQINTLSAKQLGMGHTGVAQKLGSESMIFNPAGMGFSDKTLDLSGSVTAIKSNVSANYKGTTYETESGISTPLSVNASFRIYDNFQAGISFYTPYGSSIDWTNDWPGAELNQRVDLKIYTVQPTFSWRVLPKLSVGAGLMITWGNVDLNKALVSGMTMDALTGTPVFGNSAAASVNLKGASQVSLGFNIGAMYDINSQWTVGASFRSRMAMKVKAGTAHVNYANETAKMILEKRLNLINEENFSAEMPCPWILNFGASYKPIKNLLLAADFQLTGWRTYKELNIEFPGELMAFNQNITKSYSNSWTFHLGAEYGLTERFDLRAGLMIDTTPVSKQHYNPETPGMTKIEPTVGFSFRPIKRLSIDFAFMYIAGLGADNASCTYKDMLTGKKQTFTADYDVTAYAPSIGISYKF